MSYWEKYEVRMTPMNGKIHVKVLFWLHGGEVPDPGVYWPLGPWESHVGPPNWLERLFGITWKAKLAKAVRKAHVKAQERIDRSRRSYEAAQEVIARHA